ncbi:MAG: TonB family protein [Gammaproteobacteria bacterium]|nr:TonB family protein [Gammaproteobacteria bacterium]
MRKIKLFAVLVCGLLLLPNTYAAEDRPAPTMFPIEIVVPDYPLKAALERIGGFVMVTFDVTAEGVVMNPKVSFAHPAEIFNESALAAALKLLFRPQIRRGAPIDVQNVQYFFTFNPEESFDLPDADD